MNTVAVTNQQSLVSHSRSVSEMMAQVQVIQQMLHNVMKQDVHFGKIPGTAKPTLFKPGAEVIGVTFRISPAFETEDLSDHDTRRYRVKCVGEHQPTGTKLGEGVGECSSNEEKYKWRRAVCKEEFEATPADRRRVKYGRNRDDGVYTVEQVRTEPDDIANTVLKMAAKRAQIHMILNVTAASDCFAQDLEDLSEEVREGVTERSDSGRGAARGKPQTSRPQSRSQQQRTQQQGNAGQGRQPAQGAQQQGGAAQKEPPKQTNQAAPAEGEQKELLKGEAAGGGVNYVGPAISAEDLATVRQKLVDYGMPAQEVLKQFGVPSLEKLFAASVKDVIEYVVSSNEAGARG